ncbi:MAG TPA: TIGR03435 family protein [Vicinamibacterales bacterium]|nr:TIGR03435 family protein [Vicinamibacterales bacterium]
MTTRAVGAVCAASLAAGIIGPNFAVQAASLGRPQDKPRYETATIKPCKAEDQIPGPARGTAGGTNAAISPGRFNVPCVTAEQLIYLAYAGAGGREGERLLNQNPGAASDDKKVRGGPSWVHSYRDKWAIEATAPGATEREILMGSMLRTLLEDRFKLKLHREREEIDMFALTVAKSGVKMQPMKPGECDPDMSTPVDMNAAKPKCGNMNTNLKGPNAVWTFAGFELSFLATRLSSTLGRTVTDRTGLKDEFIIRLEFHPDDNTPGIKWPPERDADTSVPQAATIFTALEQQLGLKLERVKGPREFLVIDSIEKPGPAAPRPDLR